MKLFSKILIIDKNTDGLFGETEYNKYFTKKEKNRILETQIVSTTYKGMPPKDQWVWMSSQCTITDEIIETKKEKVKFFNLSMKDITKYFPEQIDRTTRLPVKYSSRNSWITRDQASYNAEGKTLSTAYISVDSNSGDLVIQGGSSKSAVWIKMDK